MHSIIVNLIVDHLYSIAGVGGYISSSFENPERSIGFAKYCVSQLMSCDPKFRNNTTYISTLLIVKELIMIKRSLTTYLRQATMMPNLSKQYVMNMKQANLSRFNKGFQVYKTMRGTSCYYEESKKNLFALLRQLGSPNLFFTFSMAEFQWEGLLKEILETVYRRQFSKEEIDSIGQAERNKIIANNYVQSTMQFQKRLEKIFPMMKQSNFFSSNPNHSYKVSNFYYRIEFQQRG